MAETDKPIANPIVVLREEFDDWAVLFNPDTAEAVGVSPVGVAIWKLLDGKNTVNDIVEQIGTHFRDVPAEAGDQVVAFVTELQSHGFVGCEA